MWYLRSRHIGPDVDVPAGDIGVGGREIGYTRKNKFDIIPIPGVSAISASLAVSGFSEKFFFYGFFPDKINKLKEDLNTLSHLNSSIIFFVSPKKINKII